MRMEDTEPRELNGIHISEEPQASLETQEPEPLDTKKEITNVKGRGASVFSLIFWGILISFIIIKGDYSAYPVLMLVLFLLLEVLTGVRLIQEFREDGVWLD